MIEAKYWTLTAPARLQAAIYTSRLLNDLKLLDKPRIFEHACTMVRGAFNL
jgi:hypothetical protein